MEDFTVSYWEQHKTECLQLLTRTEILDQIPFLNDINSKNRENKLVRFRGMVQDILNPEYYFEKCEVRNTITGTRSVRSGKYRDFICCEENEEVVMNPVDNIHGEKHVVRCVQVPGLNSWTKHFKYIDNQDNVNVRNEKRKLEEVEAYSETMEVESNSVDTAKRLATENLSLHSNNSSNANFKCNTEQSFATLSSNSQKNVIQDCLLNFYDVNESDLKLNDVIEVIGFLSVESFNKPHEEDEINETPNSLNLLPRIHVIHIVHNVSIFNDMLQYHKEHIFLEAKTLREELWLMFTDILAGDTLAADYLICHLISSVYTRQDLLALGKFSLNLSNVPSTLMNDEYVNELYKFLSFLLEKSRFLPITISYLNNATMIPKKDNDKNCLISGILQVSSNTHLIVDETVLEPGQLIEKGVRNVQALSDIISHQKLEYDFEFYRLPFDTDIPILTLSLRKSLFPTDCHLVVETDISCLENISEAFSRTWKKMADPLLSKLRVYLNTISSVTYNLPSDVVEIIQGDYVKMRMEDHTINADNLHSLLVLARLLCLSHGKNSLDKSIWDYACLMEKQRRKRIERYNVSNSNIMAN